MDIAFKFTKMNLKMQGKDESEDTLALTVPPGGEHFILFEKVDKNLPSKIKFNFKYSTARVINSDQQVIAEIMENSKTSPPERIEYKKDAKKLVYLHTLKTKDSIYFLWENKTPIYQRQRTRSSIDSGKRGILKEKDHKHHHRCRDAETTIQAKYTFYVQNLTLVGADKENEDTWSFKLPGGGEKLLKKMKRVNFDKPGTQYSYATSAQFKFIE